MLLPRQSTPKRLPFRRSILPIESTPKPNTPCAVHYELLAHEEVYLAYDGSMEPSSREYARVTTETLSHKVGREYTILVTTNNPRLESRAQPKRVVWVDSRSTQYLPPRFTSDVK